MAVYRRALAPSRPLALAAVALLAAVSAACSKAEAPPAPAPRVKTMVLGEVAVGPEPQSALRSEGQTVAILSDERTLRAELDGQVVEVMVRAGASVRAGQALVRLDPADTRLADSAARLQAEAAKAELAAAEADFRRFQKLRDDSFISQAEFDRRRAQLEVARAQYESRLDQLGVLSARALSAAQVSSVEVRPGQAVKSGQVLAKLAPAKPPASASEGVQAPLGEVPREAIQVPLGALVGGTAVFRVIPLEAAAANGATHQLQRVEVRRILADVEGALVVGPLQKGDRIVALGAHLLQDGQPVRLLP